MMRDFHQAQDSPRQSLGLEESQKLLAIVEHGAQRGGQAAAHPRPPPPRHSAAAHSPLLIVFPRIAGEGGRRWRRPGCQCHARAARVGHVLCTIHHGERRCWARVSATSRASGLQAGPVHIHGGTALQRPLELVTRQVLPDGGLGAGCVSQFPPDHL